MSLKINSIVAILIIAGILILSFALFRGCRQSQKELVQYNKTDSLNKELLKTIADSKISTDSTKKQFQDSLEFVNGQYSLAKEQALNAETNLQGMIQVNRALIEGHKLAKYADTSAVVVPNGFIVECEGCFTNLERTTNEVERYKKDIGVMEVTNEKRMKMYQNRFKELDAEKLGFYSKINTLAKAQKEAIDKLKPHGRLYLSWGVLWSPFPIAAGAGLMYQNKRNLIWGVKCFYGDKGTIVETNINFPLSLRLK